MFLLIVIYAHELLHYTRFTSYQFSQMLCVLSCSSCPKMLYIYISVPQTYLLAAKLQTFSAVINIHYCCQRKDYMILLLRNPVVSLFSVPISVIATMGKISFKMLFVFQVFKCSWGGCQKSFHILFKMYTFRGHSRIVLNELEHFQNTWRKKVENVVPHLAGNGSQQRKQKWNPFVRYICLLVTGCSWHINKKNIYII